MERDRAVQIPSAQKGQVTFPTGERDGVHCGSSLFFSSLKYPR
uniref:Uncharacterized protein n=1 Tax=Anguilla anguilla TaxID=7936 RepID=A0A0E9USR5_ANGAN